MSGPGTPSDAPSAATTSSREANGGPPASGLPLAPEAALQVRLLQDDLRELLHYVACRADAALTSDVVGDSRLGPASLEVHAAMLVVAPETIAREARLLGQLYAALEALTTLAAPATVRSIRLTRAFVLSPEDKYLPNETRVVARRLLCWAWMIAAFAVFIFLATIALLVHVDRGRRAVQQLQQVNAEYRAAADSLNVARSASLAVSAPHGYDCLAAAALAATPSLDGPTPPAGQDARAHQERLLCAQMSEALQRLRIVRQELRAWNVISRRLAYASPVTWLTPRESAETTGLTEEEWKSTELRTLVAIAAMTGFVMPVLLGSLGACVYLFREIDHRIETSTLDARQSVHGTLRLLTGAILGGLLGTIWTDGQAVQLEGVPLSLGALAFFVGFSVEVVFRLVDTLVHAVADRVSKPR